MRVKDLLKIKIKFVTYIGLSLVIASALVQTFGLTESKVGNSSAGSSPRIHTNEVRPPTTQSDQDVYYAILLMPKSYLPLLEAFKSRKIAKDIKILPAEITWSDGKMVAVSKRTIKNGGYRQLDTVGTASGEEEIIDEIPANQEDRTFRSLLPLLFLQGLAESKPPHSSGN